MVLLADHLIIEEYLEVLEMPRFSYLIYKLARSDVGWSQPSRDSFEVIHPIKLSIFEHMSMCITIMYIMMYYDYLNLIDIHQGLCFYANYFLSFSNLVAKNVMNIHMNIGMGINRLTHC